MSTKMVAIVSIQLAVVTLVLVAILVTLQGQNDAGFTVESMPWCQPGEILNCRQPMPVTVVP